MRDPRQRRPAFPGVFKEPTFYGDRLKQARQIRAMRRRELAAALGIHRVELARFEDGKDLPPREIVESAAVILSWPVKLFYRPPGPGFAPETCSFRIHGGRPWAPEHEPFDPSEAPKWVKWS